MFLVPITVAVPFVMKVLELISFIPVIPAVIGSPKSGLQEFVVGSLGDIFVVITDEAQSSGLRDGLLRELRKIAKDDPDARLVILAHSTGNLIVYEALAELRKIPRILSVKNIKQLPQSWKRPVSSRFRPQGTGMPWTAKPERLVHSSN